MAHADMQRAYARFTVKELNDEQRVIEGVASTPAVDRIGDIVEPKGAQFKLPLPLLWAHQHDQPVGVVEQAKVTRDGITVRARLAAEGALADVDLAWKRLKAGLIRGLSIGFRPLPEGVELTEDGNGLRFKAWEWLELSLVTVPANQEASITAIKAYDKLGARSAAFSDMTASSSAARALQPSPGVTGQRHKGTTMTTRTTYAERIATAEAKRAETAARIEDMLADDGDVTMSDEQKQAFDSLDADLRELDETIKRLKRSEEIVKMAAQPVLPDAGRDEGDASGAPGQLPAATPQRVPAGQIRIRSNLKPGIAFARYAMALYQAKGSIPNALNVVLANKSWMDTSPQLATVMRAAVAAGDTTTSGWASELVYAQNVATEFIEFLRPQTIMGRVPGWRTVPFNMRVASQTAGSTGYWVGQRAAIPMSKPTTGSQTLGITKLAGLVAIDDELARSSSPSAEQMVRDDLAAAIAYLADRSMIDPTQGGVANVQPAAITYGITPVTPSGTNYAALAADFQSLTAAMITADQDLSPCVWIMSVSTAQALSLMLTSLGQPQFPGLTATGGSLFGFPVIVSQSAYFASGSPDYGNMIVFVNPREVFVADDGGITVDISNQASLEMSDAPSNDSSGTGAQLVSMFQTSTLAIRAVRYLNWAVRRTNACAFIRNANYS